MLKALIYFALFVPHVLFAAPSVISTTAGLVNDHVVTSREVEINFLLEKALNPKTKGLSNLQPPPLSSREFIKEVNSTLLEWMVHLEAESFNSAQLKIEEIEQAENSVKARLKNNARWRKLQVGKQELRSLLSRKLQAKKFIRFKADSSIVPITEAEAKKYFEDNRLKFGDLPFENFRENIKAFLLRQQVDRRLKDWFEVLRSKYNVRNYLAEGTSQ